MTSSTGQDPKKGTGTIHSGNMVPATPAEPSKACSNATTSRDIKVRAVRSERTEGQTLLRYSPRPPTIGETSTQG